MNRWVHIVVAALKLLLGSTAGARPATVATHVVSSNACLLTDHGVLAATQGGLVRTGPNGPNVWTKLDGLPGTRIHSLAKSTGALVWVGTERGLTEVDTSSHSLVIKRSVASKPVRDILVDKGMVYIATWGDGLWTLGTRGMVKIAVDGGNGLLRATSLAKHKGKVYLGTAGSGVFVLTGARLQRVALEKKTVWSLRSHKGKLYVGASDGLFTLDERIAEGDIRAMAADNGTLIAASFGRGLVRLRGQRWLRDPSLPKAARYIRGVHKRGQAMCIATQSGVWQRNKSWTRINGRPGPPANDISALASSVDRLWVGTFDHGLAFTNGDTWTAITHPAIDHHINALVTDHKKHDRLWVATSAGLAIVDQPSSAKKPTRVRRLGKQDGLPTRHILSLWPLSGGGVLVGTTRGAAIVRDGKRVQVIGNKQGLWVKNVWAVAQDSDGWLWIGTTQGLYRGKANGSTSWTRFSVATGHLRDDWVMGLVIRKGQIYVGTYKGGVTRLDKSAMATKNVRQSIVATHLGEGWINPGGLRFVGNKLYAATMEGVRVLDLATDTWSNGPLTLGKDATAVAHNKHGLWLASRRGLRFVPR